MRPNWNDIRVNIMTEYVYEKFRQNDDLKELLLATGDEEIVEGNHWHDIFWGVCTCDRHIGDGANHLGEILMEVRRTLDKSS